MQKLLNPKNLMTIGGLILAYTLPQLIFNEDYEIVEVVEEPTEENPEENTEDPEEDTNA